MTAAQPNPSPSPRPSSGLFSLKRMPLIIGIVVVLIILAVVGSMYLPKSGKSGDKVSNGLPLNPNSPGVSNVVAIYSFSGTVKSITPTTLDLDPAQIPSLKITDKTPVFKAPTDKKSQTASIKDLKSGTKVSVTASYSLSTTSWQVTRIVLQP